MEPEISPMDVVVIGAAGSGLKVLEILEAQAADGNHAFKLVGFLDDDPALQGTKFFDYPVLGAVSEAGAIVSGGEVGAICAIGDPQVRANIIQNIGRDYIAFPNVIHPSAQISERASVGVGNIVSQNVVVQPGAQIGDFNSFNIASVMGPLAKVNNFCTINAMVMIASRARVEDHCYFGMGAKIKPRITVAQGTRVGANAFVSRSTKPWTTVFGVPAKKIATRNRPES